MTEEFIHQLWLLTTWNWFRSLYVHWFPPWRTLRWDLAKHLSTHRLVLFGALIMCRCWLYLPLQNISSDIIGFTGDEATRRNLKSLIKTLSRLLWRCYECRNRIAAHWPSFHKVVSILRKRKKKEACHDPGRSSGSFWPLTYRCLVVIATWFFVCFFPLFFLSLSFPCAELPIYSLMLRLLPWSKAC